MADRSNDNVARCYNCKNGLPENFAQNHLTSNDAHLGANFGFGNHFLNVSSSQIEVQSLERSSKNGRVPESNGWAGEKRRRVERGLESDSDDSE